MNCCKNCIFYGKNWQEECTRLNRPDTICCKPEMMQSSCYGNNPFIPNWLVIEEFNCSYFEELEDK